MAELYVIPDAGKKPAAHDGQPTQTLAAALGKARPGDVIVLLPGTYSTPQEINGLHGAPERPITIKGIRGRTWFDGGRTPDPDEPQHPPSASDWALFRLRDCSWLVFDSGTVRNCWPLFCHIRDSRYLTFRKFKVDGCSFVVFAHDVIDRLGAPEDQSERSHHILLEEMDWTQDVTAEKHMWHTWHWKTSKKREHGYLNGALFGSRDIVGGIVMRRCRIRHAFNGLLMDITHGRRIDDPQHDGTDEPNRFYEEYPPGHRNINVEAYDNDFAYLRDNPVELESSATNWWVHNNRFFNCHSWFSMHNVGGGYWYIFANTGWFDDKPGAPNDGGKVLKWFYHTPFPRWPVFVFHNSWYLRTGVVAGDSTFGGESRNIRHWNNAIALAPAARHGGLLLRAGRRFLNNVTTRVLTGDDPISGNDFDNDVASLPGFPASLQAEGQEANGRHVADLGWRDPAHGDFRPRHADGPLSGIGRRIELRHDEHWYGGTTWRNDTDGAPDVGAYDGDAPFMGPAFAVFPAPGYEERPRIVAYRVAGTTLELTFSCPLAAAAGAVLAAELSWREMGRPQRMAADHGVLDGRVLRVDFPRAEPLSRLGVAALTLPAGLHRDGRPDEPATSWASRLGNVSFG